MVGQPRAVSELAFSLIRLPLKDLHGTIPMGFYPQGHCEAGLYCKSRSICRYGRMQNRFRRGNGDMAIENLEQFLKGFNRV
jgi:hypothetical protein